MGQGFTSLCGGGGYDGCSPTFVIFLILILLLLGNPYCGTYNVDK